MKVTKIKIEPDYKKKWEILKKCLELEIKLISKSLIINQKEQNYPECLIDQEQILTINWILTEMEHIKETNKTL